MAMKYAPKNTDLNSLINIYLNEKLNIYMNYFKIAFFCNSFYLQL